MFATIFILPVLYLPRGYTIFITDDMTTTMQAKDEKVVIIGFGWVGQANALALSQIGYDVFYYDVLPPKQHYKGTEKHFYEKVVKLNTPLEVDGSRTSYMVCVGDRVGETGGQDVTFIRQALESLRDAKGTIILRSTVIPKTLPSLIFDYYIPEFLHEKFAIQECIRPYMFALGAGTRNPEAWIPGYVTMWQERAQKVFVGTYSEASYVKYYSNMWNAVRVAFVNELGDILSQSSKSENPVQGAERVINFLFEGKSYMRYGRGFGGHCLPKDMRAFLTAYGEEFNTSILSGAYESNRLHEEFEVASKKALPEWFSAWDYESIVANQRKVLRVVMHKLYQSAPVTFIRHLLKPLVIFAERFVSPRSNEEMRALWEQKANENARYYVNQKTKSGEFVDETEIDQTGKEDFERLILADETLQNLLPSDLENTVVLDLGSGIGRLTEPFSRVYGKVYGVDISPTMVQIAERRLGELSNVEFTMTDGSAIPYPDQSFDLIFSNLVFPHIDNVPAIEKYLSEIHRTLKKGGVAKIQLRTGPGVRRWVWSYGVSFQPDEVNALAKKTNLTIIDTHIKEVKYLWVTLKKD